MSHIPAIVDYLKELNILSVIVRILLASGIVLFLFAFTKKTMSRWEGAACILMYVGYTAYLFVR